MEVSNRRREGVGDRQQDGIKPRKIGSEGPVGSKVPSKVHARVAAHK